MAASYEFDHDHYGPDVFDVLQADLAELAIANGQSEVEVAHRIHRSGIALHEHMRLHIAKENALLLPVLADELDLEEQIAIASGMGQVMPPQVAGPGMARIYAMRSPAERVPFVARMSQVLPPPAFEAVSGLIASADPDGWPAVREGALGAS